MRTAAAVASESPPPPPLAHTRSCAPPHSKAPPRAPLLTGASFRPRARLAGSRLPRAHVHHPALDTAVWAGYAATVRGVGLGWPVRWAASSGELADDGDGINIVMVIRVATGPFHGLTLF